jgi:hypothetical protein
MGDKQIHKGILIEMDFNFQYFTHKKINRESITYCIYYYEYTTKEKSKFVVISPGAVDFETARRKPKGFRSTGQYNDL